MNLTTARTHTKIHLQHRMKTPVDQRVNSIIIWLGDSGFGKSSNVKKLANELGVRYCRWDANAQLFDDNLGIPDPDGKLITNDDGSTRKVTVNMDAELLPVFEDEPILLEMSELPTAPQNVLNQIRQIIDGIFTNKPVSPTCMIVATGNPMTTDYTTVNADLCRSIEERLHPYIIVPDTAELLSIWSTMMAPVVYQFLLGSESLVERVSPRGWVEIAAAVQALVEADMPPEAIIHDIRPKIDDTIRPPLLKFLKMGYQPDKVPILGRELLGSSEPLFKEHMDRVRRWLKSNERGFVGATQLDVARILTQSDETFIQKYPEAGNRFTKFVEVLVEGKAQDIASSLIDALYKSNKDAVAKPIMSTFRKSPALLEMGKKFREFTQRFEAAVA
jgi:hypothetical protein